MYRSWRHVAATAGLIILPLAFLLGFAHISHLETRVLITNLLVSLGRIAIAYVLSAFIGWGCAVLFYKGRRGDIALPVFDVLQSFPTYAALPLAVLYWGASNFTVIVFLILAIVWPIFFSVISSLKLIRRDWQEAVEISGLHGWDYVRKFLIPVSMPGLMTGSVIGLGDGWEALVATEIIVGLHTGLGAFFQSSSENLQVTLLGIFGLLLVIFAINKLIWLPLLNRSHQLTEE